MQALVVTAAGSPPLPSGLWGHWHLDPLLVLALVAAGAAYARGSAALWKRGGRAQAPRATRMASFFAGLAVVFAALMSPLDAAARALFSMHMIQHLALMLVAAPLIVLARPVLPLLLAVPVTWRRRIHALQRSRLGRVAGRWIANPFVAWSLYVVVLWAWHLPALYDAAVDSDAVHVLEHASFLSVALLFWWLVAEPGPGRRLGYGPAVLFVFFTAIQGGALGAVLTFAAVPLYASHDVAALWGLTPLQDQQLAGVIMWVPTGVIHTVVAAVMLVRWLNDMEARMRLRESGVSAGGGR